MSIVCLSPSSGNALFPDFYFFKYLWECQNGVTFSVWNQSYTKHLELEPVCISLPPSYSEPLCGISFPQPYWAEHLYLCGCQRNLFSRSDSEFKQWQGSSFSFQREQQGSLLLSQPQACLYRACAIFRVLHTHKHTHILPGNHRCHWFCTLFCTASHFDSTTLHCCFFKFCSIWCIYSTFLLSSNKQYSFYVAR